MKRTKVTTIKNSNEVEVIYGNYRLIELVRVSRTLFYAVALAANNGDKFILLRPYHYSAKRGALVPLFNKQVVIPLLLADDRDDFDSDAVVKLAEAFIKAHEEAPFFDHMDNIIYKGDLQCISVDTVENN